MSILFVFVCTCPCALLLSHIQLFAALPNCSPPGCSVYGISQPRILERVAISYSRGSTLPKYQICIFCIGRQVLYHKCHLGSPNDYMLLVLLLVRPHRRQPTRLPRPWGSPGKNTGVGCHFLLQCMKVKSESEVAQSCPTPSDTMDCSLPGSSVHGIFQARVLEWGAIAFSQ